MKEKKENEIKKAISEDDSIPADKKRKIIEEVEAESEPADIKNLKKSSASTPE